MEIRASQRRGVVRAPHPLHQKLARRYGWQQRLVWGGVLALLCSVAAWLLGLSLPLHLGLVGLGLLLGLFWRFGHTSRRARAWAFGWIEGRSGLAYLTAFELPEINELPETDAHGLAEAVRARAAKAATLDMPPLQPWFLPLVVLALMLALVPHLALPVLRAPFAPLSETGTRTPEAVPPEVVPGLEDDATAQDATTTDTAATPETGSAADPETAATNPDAQRSFDTAGGAEEEGVSEAQGEQAALDRFLEQTEAAEVSAMQAQRGPSETAAPTQGERAGGAQRGGATGAGEAEPGSAVERRDAPTASPEAGGQNAAAPPGQGTPIEQEASSSQDPESEGEMGQRRGEPGLSDTEKEAGRSAQGPEMPTEEPSTLESQRAESASAESDRQNESLARTGEPTVQRGATSDENSQVTQDIRDGQNSERGGTRGGADIDSSRERLGGRNSAPERITGIRGAGPTTFGGEALQQGQTPDTLPETGDAGTYRRAAEEVIREGRIPLEYQEIVRDYFR